MQVLGDIEKLIAGAESESLELKRTTGQLKPAGQTLCAFLNGQGGNVVIGATDTRTHKSVLRNPLIAEAFHRTGAVEVWGRGTNRVIEECQRYGIESLTFEEDDGFLVVTFRVQIGPITAKSRHVGTQSALSRHQVQVLEKAKKTYSIAELMELYGRSDRTKFQNQVVRPLLESGLLEMTIPDKPRSSQQRYRTTEAGKQILKKA